MYRVLDMFGGCGGSSQGAAAAGFAVAAAVDADSLACRTFKHNFPRAKIYNKLLEDLDPEEVQRATGSIDLIMASPECTNHSCAKGSAPRCEKSRGTALQVLRYSKVLRPRWVVIENVPQMQTWTGYESLMEELSGQGYRFSEHLLDAANFTVPQRRRRLFVTAVREGEPPPLIRGSMKQVPARDILDPFDAWKTSLLRKNKRAKATLARADRAIDALGPNIPFLIVYYGSDGAGGWQSLDVPLRTITTLDRFAYVKPVKGVHRMRMLQVPELMRAMGFSGNFVLPYGTRRDRIRLTGNAVCPPVMTAILRTLVQAYEKNHSTAKSGLGIQRGRQLVA